HDKHQEEDEEITSSEIVFLPEENYSSPVFKEEEWLKLKTKFQK
ncbi:15196_t:CDS:2, partial [Entrophospora sp. SA101]